MLSLIPAVFLDLHFFLILILYLFLTNIYNLFFKKIFILDSINISSLYLLRIIAGSIVTKIPSSFWLMIISFIACFFIILTKRFSELKNNFNNRPKEYFLYKNIVLKIILILMILLFIFYFLYIINHIKKLGYFYFVNFILFIIFFIKYYNLTKNSQTEYQEKFYKNKTLLWLFIFQLIIIFISFYK
jgi:4-hydroxybenzoate polyprenyltransferase